jgi:hypothetical protein
MAYNVRMDDLQSNETESPIWSETGSAAPEADDDENYVIKIDWRRVVIGAFLIWQIFAVTVWIMPDAAPRTSLMPIVTPYMLTTGCWQAWTMFSPSPAKFDAFVDARILFNNGQRTHFDFYRMNDEGLVEKYQRERFRKMIENFNLDSNKQMWPYLARYAATMTAVPNRNMYPMRVQLVRVYRTIAPPPWNTPAFQEKAIYTQTFFQPPLGWSSVSSKQ